MTTFFVTVEGAQRLESALRGVAANFADLRPAWRPVSDEIYSIIRAQFNTEGTRGSGRWPKRAESTLNRITAINRRGFSVIGLPLRATNALHNSLTTRGGAHGIYIEEPQELTMGTDLPYFGFHQQGGSKIPQRKIVDLTDADGRRILSIVKRGLMHEIADRGFDVTSDDGGLPF